MTTATLKRLATALIGTSATSLYAPAGVAARIHGFTLNNTSGSSVVVTVYLPAGGAVGAVNQIVTVTLAASGTTGSSYVVNEALNQTVEDGSSIQAIAATGGVVSAVISGVEVA